MNFAGFIFFGEGLNNRTIINSLGRKIFEKFPGKFYTNCICQLRAYLCSNDARSSELPTVGLQAATEIVDDLGLEQPAMSADVISPPAEQQMQFLRQVAGL
jgi:hypothetical protein